MELMYLPVRAKAEPLRLIAAYANLPLRNVDIPFSSWPEVKKTLPPGKTGSQQVPVLKLEDGTMMPESHDIAQHLARKAGPPMMPSDPSAAERAAFIFELCTAEGKSFCCPELGSFSSINPMLNWFPASEGHQRFEAAVPALADALVSFEAELGEGPFFTGEEPCYADFQVFHYLDNLSTLDGGRLLKAHGGKLEQFYHAVAGLPGVKEYLKGRPEPGSEGLGREGSLIASSASPSSS